MFLSLWAADAARWWIGGAASARTGLRTAMSCLALFMFFNGAVVFAHGWHIRMPGIVATVIVIAAWRRAAPVVP